MKKIYALTLSIVILSSTAVIAGGVYGPAPGSVLPLAPTYDGKGLYPKKTGAPGESQWVFNPPPSWYKKPSTGTWPNITVIDENGKKQTIKIDCDYSKNPVECNGTVGGGGNNGNGCTGEHRATMDDIDSLDAARTTTAGRGVVVTVPGDGDSFDGGKCGILEM